MLRNGRQRTITAKLPPSKTPQVLFPQPPTGQADKAREGPGRADARFLKFDSALARWAKCNGRQCKVHDFRGGNPTSTTPNPAKVHSFSRTIAKEHGEKAAVLFQYLAHHVAKSKHIHGGKNWFYRTLDDLAAIFPCLKRSTIHDTLKSLKDKGILMIGDYSKMGYDRTNWFALRDHNFRRQVQSSKPVYSRVEDPVEYGIVAAVLLGNLVHWIRENRKTDPQYTWHQILPGDLVEHLPFSGLPES